MGDLLRLIDHPLIATLGWTLTHFLWQGALLGLIAFFLLRVIRPQQASTRYLMSVATLATMLIVPLATFVSTSRQTASARLAWTPATVEPIGTAGAVTGSIIADFEANPTALRKWLPAQGLPVEATDAAVIAPVWLPIVTAAWMLGVVLLSLRLVGGWALTQLLARRAVRAVTREVEASAREIAHRLGIEHGFALLESATVSVPTLVGWVKPVVLLPAMALSGLSPQQLQAIIAHELAHIRRHDYLINLLQSVVETLLFYHPAVWWVSSEVRAEREHCCDDLAVQVCGDRLVYVSALAALTSIERRAFALAATDGSLVTRVRRILGHPASARLELPPSWGILVLLVVIGSGAGTYEMSADGAAVEQIAQAAAGSTAVTMSESQPEITGAITTSDAARIAATGPQSRWYESAQSAPPTPAVPAVPALPVAPPAPPTPSALAEPLPVPVAPRAPVAPAPLAPAEPRALAVPAIVPGVAMTSRPVAPVAAPIAPVAPRALDAPVVPIAPVVPRALDTPIPAPAPVAPRAPVAPVAPRTSLSQQKSQGNFSWSHNDERLAVKWTGRFRLTDDETDIAWIEEGGTVTIADGWVFTDRVELRALPGGGIERKFYRSGLARDFDADARAFLTNALQRMIRSGMFAAERVTRFLKQGGPEAVLVEVDRLGTDSGYVRRVYYSELLKQTDLTSSQLSQLLDRVSKGISSDYEKATLLMQVLQEGAITDEQRILVVRAVATISSDYEQRRVLTAALGKGPLEGDMVLAALDAVESIKSAHDRSQVLTAIAKQGGVTPQTSTRFMALVSTMPSAYEQRQVLSAVAAVPGLPETVAIDAVKAASTINNAHDKRQAVTAYVGRGDASPKVAAAALASAATISSAYDKAQVLLEVVDKGGVTDATAASFFSAVGSITSSYDMSRVLKALAAKGGLSDRLLTGLLEAARKVASSNDRASLLLTVLKANTLSGAARTLFLDVADGISSSHDQNQVLAALVRSERR